MENGVKWAIGITGGVAVIAVVYFLWKRKGTSTPAVGNLPSTAISGQADMPYAEQPAGNSVISTSTSPDNTKSTTAINQGEAPTLTLPVIHNLQDDMARWISKVGSKATGMGSSILQGGDTMVSGHSIITSVPINGGVMPASTQGTTGKPIMNQNIAGDTYTTNIFNSNCKSLIASYNDAVSVLKANMASPNLVNITKRPGLISNVNKIAQQLKDAGCGTYTTY